jgi:hypothetical protein
LPEVKERHDKLPEPVANLDGEALLKASMQGRDVTVTLSLDAFLFAWERFERLAMKGSVLVQPDTPVSRAVLNGRLAFRYAYGEVDASRSASKERTESVGVRKVQRRTPPRRR